ncbi:RNA dependent RNA polymerase-domain-containing protein [Mycena vitilis]|nr:RNA dependent RNA polymerase-domain-containing protein [Mycena vitilis]
MSDQISTSQGAYDGIDASYPVPFWADVDRAENLAAESVLPVGAKRGPPDTELLPRKSRRVDVSPESSRPIPSATKADTHPPETFSSQYLFRGHHGQDLEPFVICHSTRVQPELDGLEIARGVQWELCRGILSADWTWDDVGRKVNKLKGSNALIAPVVRDIMQGTPALTYSSWERGLWREFDREAKAMVENKCRGLGLMGSFEGVPDYYGGNLKLTVRLLDMGENQIPGVRLEPPEMSGSHHLARELGSVSVLALRDDKDGALARHWACRKFILCGRTYVALPPKDKKVYLIETDEDHERDAQAWCGDQHRVSYDEYLRKNNPLHLNGDQPLAKYFTRLNLYLSTSIPALELDSKNMFFIGDGYADGWSKEQNPPTRMVMTDGCGWLNRAAAVKIRARLQYGCLPVAYQGRIAGSKGMWVLHPTDDSPEPRIWIRDSQKKIQLGRLLRAHRIFDLVAASLPSSPARLSGQSITTLANNGVPASVFFRLQEQGLRDLVVPCMDWSRPNATAYLWSRIADVSNVPRSRLQRLAAGASRALGLEKRRYEHDGISAAFDPHSGRNLLNGEPVIVAEAAMELLQAGFDPLTSPHLSSKIHNLIKSAMESYLKGYRIPLTTSSEAYLIPDPTAKLHEGQVYYKSSRDPGGPLREEVVVGRYPMRKSSDMQKVTAVDVLDLADYVDILVVPIRGSRSFASLLAGGDMDGDEVIIIRDPVIVSSFENQADLPIPEGFLVQNFEQETQTATEFGKRLTPMTFAQAQRTFQEEALAGFRQDKVGAYSSYHDTALYNWGLDDPRTRRMANITAILLDASKSGLRLRKQVEERDRLFFSRLPRAKCFDAQNGHARPGKPPFVLDSLLVSGLAIKDELQARFETEVATHLHNDQVSTDDDIQEPYRAMSVASIGVGPIAVAIASDLKVLRDRILELRARFQESNQQFARARDESRLVHQQGKKGLTKKPDEVRLKIMHEFRQPLDGLQCLGLGNIDEIKASYAFALGYKFGFSMAFRDICEIKRKAVMKQGPFNRVAVIDEARSMDESARRLFRHLGGQG